MPLDRKKLAQLFTLRLRDLGVPAGVKVGPHRLSISIPLALYPRLLDALKIVSAQPGDGTACAQCNVPMAANTLDRPGNWDGRSATCYPCDVEWLRGAYAASDPAGLSSTPESAPKPKEPPPKPQPQSKLRSLFRLGQGRK